MDKSPAHTKVARTAGTFVSAFVRIISQLVRSVASRLSKSSTKSIPPAEEPVITPSKAPVRATFTETDLADVFEQCFLRQKWLTEIGLASARLIKNKTRYQTVTAATGVPWTAVGCIHGLEASFNFDRHFFNGDPLTGRTVHAPAGRPATGEPPFTWEQSAIDALTSVWKPKEWTLGSLLHFLEMYNGLGYRKYNIYSPYVWAATSAYTAGKFVADGSFDPQAVSNQFGAAAMLKCLAKSGIPLL